MASSAAAAAGATVTASTTAAFKYASLGINTSDQDVFETPDPPPKTAEDDERALDPEDLAADAEVPEINTAHLGSAKLAQKRFADTTLDLRGVDRSDTLKGRRGRYRVPQTVFLEGVTQYELDADDADAAGASGARRIETPLQKYMRLQHEVAELSDEIAAKAAADGASKIEQNVTASNLAANLLVLQRNLAELKSSSPTASAMLDTEAAVSALARAQSLLSEQLLAQVKSVREAGAPTGAAPAASAASTPGAALSYELYVRPDQARFERLARVGDVERRLAELEQLVGAAPADGGLGSDLQAAVVALDMRLTLLDEEKLKLLQRRISAVSQSLQELLDKKAALPEGSAAEATANSVLAKMAQWDAVVAELPGLADRLQALSQLHTEAANFSATLDRVDVSQAELAASLAAQASLLHKVEDSLATNMETVAKNLAALDTRMAALKL